MSFILDFAVAAIILFCIFTGINRSVKKSIFLMMSAAVILAFSFAASIFIAKPVEKYIMRPMYATSAANDLADMTSNQKYEDGYETVKKIDVRTLIEDNPEAFKRMQNKFKVYIDTLKNGESTNDEEYAKNVLTYFITPISKDAARTFSFVLVFAILYIVAANVIRTMDEEDKKRRGVINILINFLKACIFVFGVTGCFMIMLPYISGQFPTIFDVGIVNRSLLFKLFAKVFDIFTNLF